MKSRLIGAIAVAMLLIGCGDFSAKKGSAPVTDFVWLTRYDVKTLDPAAVQDWTTGTVLSYLYPSIGEMCDVSTNDSKSYELKLHKSTFTNGEQVTTEDIRHTIERCLCSETLSSVGNQFASQIEGSRDYIDKKAEHVQGINLDSPGIVKITLSSPDQAFVAKLKNRAFGVVNHKLVETRKPLDKYLIGDGAGNWTLEKVSPGAEWTLKHRTTGETLKFRFSGDSANRRNLFDTGAADYAMFAAHEIGVVKGHKNLGKGGPTTLVYLQCNPKTKPSLNQNLRFQMGAMVRSYLDFTKLLGNHVTPAANFLALSNTEALPTAGVASGRFTDKAHYEITFAEIGMQNPSVEGIVTAFRKAGLDIQGRAMPSGAMLEANAKGEIPMLFTGWQPDFEGPLNTIPMLFHSKSSENHSGYSNANVDRLIDAAQRGENTTRNIQEAWRIIENDAPCIPLYIQRDLVLMRREPPKP